MTHINELTTIQLKSAYVATCNSIDIAKSMGMRSAAKHYESQKSAMATRINELEPMPEIGIDELADELADFA